MATLDGKLATRLSSRSRFAIAFTMVKSRFLESRLFDLVVELEPLEDGAGRSRRSSRSTARRCPKRIRRRARNCPVPAAPVSNWALKSPATQSQQSSCQQGDGLLLACFGYLSTRAALALERVVLRVKISTSFRVSRPLNWYNQYAPALIAAYNFGGIPRHEVHRRQVLSRPERPQDERQPRSGILDCFERNLRGAQNDALSGGH